MYAFPDISEAEAGRAARCSDVINGVLRSAQVQICGDFNGVSAGARDFDDDYGLASSAPCSRDDHYHGPHDGDPKELIPDLNQAKFFALGAKFLMLQRLCLQDLSYKTFYDLAGSGGRAGLAAILLHRWSSVISLESCIEKFSVAVMARCIVQGVVELPVTSTTQPLPLPPDGNMLTKTAVWTVQRATFKSADWIDGDVVFFDATIFSTLDEGVLCRYVQGRLRALEAGSFVVLFTRCCDCLMDRSFLELINRVTTVHRSGRLGGRAEFTSWLFKTKFGSDDTRRVIDPDPLKNEEVEFKSRRGRGRVICYSELLLLPCL